MLVKKTKLKPLFKHQLLAVGLSVFIVVVATLVGSFAIFSKTDNGTEYNVVKVGKLELSYVDLNNEGNVIQLASNYPISDTTGTTATPYRFSVENTGTIPTNYVVRVIDDVDTITADGCADNLIDSAYIRYKFDHGEVGTLKDLKQSDEGGYVIATGTLQPTESNIHEVRLWINEVSSNKVLGAHFHGKVVIDMEQQSEDVPTENQNDVDTQNEVQGES